MPAPGYRHPAVVVALAVLYLLQLAVPCAANAGARMRGTTGNFLGAAPADPATNTTVDLREVESSLRASLEAVLGGRGSDAMARRTAAIEASLWRSFQALPKNGAGRLAPKSVRHLVHGYFAKENGWLIKGLESHALKSTANTTEVHETSILRDKAPGLVEKILEDREQGRGLSLEEVVAMTAALERLIFDESLALLQASYELNGLSPMQALYEDDLHEVLTSYLVVFEMGSRGDLSNGRKHRQVKSILQKSGATWNMLEEYESDAVLNYDFALRDQVNPFGPRRYSFGEATRIVESMAQGYGKFQNTECLAMKEHLMELDVDGDGRVPLSTFYSQDKNSTYQFAESVEYLRETGALDESTAAPRVLIVNYLTGPSNCIASSDYYSVCCISECEAILSDLEGRVKGPSAPAERLLALVGNISSATVDAPRQLPAALTAKLSAVAGRHGGDVPLHGRLFAQWLHFAFPNECPYPQSVGSIEALAPSHWQQRGSKVSEEELQRHTREVVQEAERDDDDVSLDQWSDEEILPLYAAQHDRVPRGGLSMVRGLLGGVALLAALAAFVLATLRAALALRDAGHVAAGAASGKKRKAKDDGFVLPTHF